MIYADQFLIKPRIEIPNLSAARRAINLNFRISRQAGLAPVTFSPAGGGTRRGARKKEARIMLTVYQGGTARPSGTEREPRA